MTEFSVAVLSLAAWVFSASAAAKLSGRRAYQLFRAGLRETALLPEHLLSAAVAVLPAAEAVTALGLAAAAVLTTTGDPSARLTAGAALAVAALLTAVLAGGVVVVMRRGTRAHCACFGPGSGRPLGGVHLVRNLVLLVMLAAGLASSAWGHGPPAPAGLVVAGAAGSVAALVFIRWDDLAGLFAPISSLPPASPRVQRPGQGSR
jgi:Methylamine utilisation protein MauE